jgi:hypothetical protein
MPDDDKKELRNDSRIVIETPLTEPKPIEKPDMDRAGRISPWTPKWHQQREGRRRESRRT